MWKLDFVWRSANQVKLPRKFLALDYQRCSRPHCLRQQKKGKTTNKNVGNHVATLCFLRSAQLQNVKKEGHLYAKLLF